MSCFGRLENITIWWIALSSLRTTGPWTIVNTVDNYEQWKQQNIFEFCHHQFFNNLMIFLLYCTHRVQRNSVCNRCCTCGKKIMSFLQCNFKILVQTSSGMYVCFISWFQSSLPQFYLSPLIFWLVILTSFQFYLLSTLSLVIALKFNRYGFGLFHLKSTIWAILPNQTKRTATVKIAIVLHNS